MLNKDMSNYIFARSFEEVLQDMLANVPDHLDKREGSIMYNALAPTAMLVAEMTAEFDILLARVYASTAGGSDLDKRLDGEMGEKRLPATHAIKSVEVLDAKGEPMELATGLTIYGGELTYTTIKTVDGTLALRCDVPGTQGNSYYGAGIAADKIDSLGSITIGQALIPAKDEETDEAYYERYRQIRRDLAFSGNRADYAKHILGFDGVGGLRLKRADNGGDFVGVYIISSDYEKPSDELVASLQEYLDPVEYAREGEGQAPMNHLVKVMPAETTEITVATEMELAPGTDVAAVQKEVEVITTQHFKDLSKKWSNPSARKRDIMVVRLSYLEALYLDVPGVVDVINTTLNGKRQNIDLGETIPTVKEVTVNATA